MQGEGGEATFSCWCWFDVNFAVIMVVVKEDLLAGKDLEELNNMTWD